MPTAVDFERTGSDLILVYTPRDDDSWVIEKFDRGEDLTIKGTFHLRKDHLISDRSQSPPHEVDEFVDGGTVRFKVAELKGEYYRIDMEILPVGYPVLIHRDAEITWKWFTAEQRTSIFGVIAELRPGRIVIGGDEPDAIPLTEYERLIAQFPTNIELKRYVLARVASVVREYSETTVDSDKLFRKYLNRRLRKALVHLGASGRLPDILCRGAE